MHNRTRKRVQIKGPMYWKDLSPMVILPILGTRNIREQNKEQREMLARGLFR